MRNPQNREAISPVIATIIIVAVAIAIALAAAAWLMGIWGVFIGGPRVSASLVSITNASNTGSGVNITVVFSNTGTTSDTIIAVVISNATSSHNFSLSGLTTEIPAGGELTVSFSDTHYIVSPGKEYTVEITLKSGEKITLVGVAKAESAGS